MSEQKKYQIIDKKEENKELSLNIKVEKDFVDNFKERAVKSAGKDLEVKGFRKGEVPEKIVIEKLGEMAIFQEQAYIALNEILPILVAEEKIQAITNPKVEITKMVPNEELELKATFALMPEVELPDYKKIAKEVKPVEKSEVTDKEIDEYIDYIRKQKAEASYMQKKTSGEKVDEKEKENLPELNDEFIKTLGDFKDVDDFKKQLRENMQKDKETKADQGRKIEIIENIIKEAKVDLPSILVDEEVEKMAQNFRAQIEQMKIKYEDYIKQIGKTEEEMKKEWRADAEKRVKTDLILPKIAKAEDIKPDEERIKKELEHLKEHHKDINEDHAKVYITHALTNEKVFDFLANIK
jgi:FKBP-type peptidyl-prolyl cis-trans isomerase (trigger factor)